MVRLSIREFDRVVEDVIASIPEPFREVLDHVPVIVDPYPSDEVAAQTEHAEELMGLFVGPPISEWNASDAPPETAVIYLFHRQIENACTNRREVADEVRITLLHELGHCLGFDEDGLERIGLD